ncbi:hypothetical protein [Aquirhabdus sp.]|uniref:hypothetical protein n=1 Tax=Aquirhabdus sp. TaxID=2824160 RepID=UPI00396CA224
MDNLFIIVFGLLGFFGALGFSLIPLRLWRLIYRRRIDLPITTKPMDILLTLSVICAMVFAVFIGFYSVPRLYLCLVDSHQCSADRAGGMIHLASFGIGVAILELTWLVASMAQRYFNDSPKPHHH